MSDADEIIRRLAKAAEKRSDWAEAATYYERLLTGSEPEFWDRFRYVQALILSGQLKAAEAHLNGLRAADGGHPADVEMLAAAFGEQSGSPETADMWRRARELGASEYWTSYGEARDLVRRGELRRARELTDRFVTSAEAENTGLRFAASVYFRAGEMQAAERMMAAIQASQSDRLELVLHSLPGMTWLPERMAIYNAARQIRVPGHFVDLGAFLGSLTVPLLRGLQENEYARRNGTRVYAFDRFLWHPPMDPQWPDTFPGTKPERGARFRHAFEFVVATWGAHFGFTPDDLSKDLTVVETDLGEYKWTHGDISLLSVDAMKVPALACAIVSEFMTKLVRGGLCFHQDFGVETNWFIHIHQYLLKDRFEIADHVPGMSGIMFRLREPISEADVERVCSHDLWDTKTADQAFAYWSEQVHEQDRATIAAIHDFYQREIAPNRGRVV
jgi:hypothetical protein